MAAVVLTAALSRCVLVPAPFSAADRNQALENPRFRDIAFVLDVWTPPYWQAPPSRARQAYWPVGDTVLAGLVAAFGASPLLFRGAVILVHVAAAVLLLRLLCRLAPERTGAATLAAMLFAAHPSLTAALVQACEFGEVLGAALGFAALDFFVRSCREQDRLRAANATLLCPVFLAGALLCSPAGLTAPVLMAVIAWTSGGARARRKLASPLLILVLYVAFVGWSVPPRPSLRALGAAHMALPERSVVSASAFGTYWLHLWWPRVPRSFDLERWFEPAHLLLAALAVLALGAVVLLSLRRPQARLGLLWTPLALLPAVQVFPIVAPPHGDARLYWPAAGMCVLLGGLLGRLFSRRVAVLAMAVQAALFGMSVSRACLEARPDAAARLAFRHAPGDVLAMQAVAEGLLRAGNDRAAVVILRSLQRKLFYRGQGRALALARLGAALGRSGRKEDALPALRRALAINPALFAARVDLARLLIAEQSYDEALQELARAHSLDNTSAEPLYLMALAWEKKGRGDWARVYARYALEREPGHAGSKEILDRAGRAGPPAGGR